MRDPDRLSSSKGISDFERELLDAGKNESLPAALREQMERALGLPGAAAGAPVRARVEAATGVKASAIVWISAGVVVLGVVGGIVGARLGSRLFPPGAVAPATATAPSEQPAAALHASGSAVASAGAPATAVIPAATSPASAAPVEPDLARGAHVSPSPAVPARRPVAVASSSRSRAHAAIARGPGPRHGHASSSAHASSPANAVMPADVAAPVASSAPADDSTSGLPARARGASSEAPAPARAAVAPSGDLRAEIDLIDAARAALRAGDAAEALDLLGRHAVHFPHGALAPEETALRVEALMRVGHTGEARAYARRFIAANPASPLAERMRRLVNGATAP